MKLFFYLAILIGVGYAAQRVPVGDKTAVQHLREHVRWESIRQGSADAVAAVREFFAEEPSPVVAADGPANAPANASAVPVKANEIPSPDPRSDDGDRPPAERITAADRRALEELLPR